MIFLSVLQFYLSIFLLSSNTVPAFSHARHLRYSFRPAQAPAISCSLVFCEHFSVSPCLVFTAEHGRCMLVMERYIVQTIYRVDIGHIVSYRYRQEKYRNFDISLAFRYRFNIGETTPTVCYPIVCIFTRLSGDYGRLAYLCRTD